MKINLSRHLSKEVWYAGFGLGLLAIVIQIVFLLIKAALDLILGRVRYAIDVDTLLNWLEFRFLAKNVLALLLLGIILSHILTALSDKDNGFTDKRT